MRQRLMKVAMSPVVWFVGGVSGKSSWEWLELLIVPLILTVGAFYLESRVEQRQERTIEARANQSVLDNYFEKMQDLLLDKALRESSTDSEVHSVARAMTTTAMKELASARNALLVDFLREADLVGSSDDFNDISLLSGLNLASADLSFVDLSSANLRSADLIGTNLFSAYLRDTNLSSANLSFADLSFADLSKANLHGASLREANLSGTNLHEANLSSALHVSEDQIKNSSLCSTDLP